MAAASSEQKAWVKRILGVDFGSPDFEARRKQLEPRLLKAVRLLPDARTALMAVWDLVGERAAKGDMAAAEAALLRLTQRIEAVEQRAPESASARYGVREGLVAERIRDFEAALQQRAIEARSAISADVGRMMPVMTELIVAPSELVDAINRQLHDMVEVMRGELIESFSAKGERGLQDTAAAWRARIDSDPKLIRLRSAARTLGIPVNVDAAFGSVLDECVPRTEAVA